MFFTLSLRLNLGASSGKTYHKMSKDPPTQKSAPGVEKTQKMTILGIIYLTYFTMKI